MTLFAKTPQADESFWGQLRKRHASRQRPTLGEALYLRHLPETAALNVDLAALANEVYDLGKEVLDRGVIVLERRAAQTDSGGPCA